MAQPNGNNNNNDNGNVMRQGDRTPPLPSLYDMYIREFNRLFPGQVPARVFPGQAPAEQKAPVEQKPQDNLQQFQMQVGQLVIVNPPPQVAPQDQDAKFNGPGC